MGDNLLEHVLHLVQNQNILTNAEAVVLVDRIRELEAERVAIIASLHTEQDRTFRYMERAERAEAELARAHERITSSEGIAAHDKLRAERDDARLLHEGCRTQLADAIDDLKRAEAERAKLRQMLHIDPAPKDNP